MVHFKSSSYAHIINLNSLSHRLCILFIIHELLFSSRSILNYLNITYYVLPIIQYANFESNYYYSLFSNNIWCLYNY